MAIEFRQRSAGEFLQMIKRRKWHIVLPMIAVGIAVGYVVQKLPSMYESKTSLTLKPPTISDKVVQSLTEDDLSQRLQSMNQEILSRSTLEPMVTKFKLFEPERNAGMAPELIIEKMQKNITVEPEKGDNEKVTGFRLTYRDRTPDAARNVAAELASKYVSAQVQSTTKGAEDTKAFIENQANQAKATLDAIEQQRLQIMMQNSDTLPEFQQNVIAQLQGLRQREDTISKEKDTLIVDKARWNQSIQAYNSQISIAESFGSKDSEDVVRQARIEDTPAYGQLIQKRADLTAKLENLKKEYREKMPIVVETQTQIAKVNEEIDDLKKSSQKRAQDAATQGNRKTELQKENIEVQKQQAVEQIKLIDQQIQGKDNEISQNRVQIAALETKMGTMPNVKIALEAINNQYQTAKTSYDEILKKKNDAQFQVDRESNAQGETIRVVDPANLPGSPVNASKKPVLIGLGAGIGLAIGLFLAAIFEVPRLFRIQNIEDAKHYTGLPVLASVPPLLTKQEISWQNRSYWFKVMTGVVVAFGSIPLLIILLQTTRIFERFV